MSALLIFLISDEKERKPHSVRDDPTEHCARAKRYRSAELMGFTELVFDTNSLPG